jgi:succinate dehydrogenase (ubiquinone) membrane anchor subunit
MLGLRLLQSQRPRLTATSLFTRQFRANLPAFTAVAAKEVPKHPYSYHWNLDRVVSVLTPMAMGGAFVYGGPMVDTVLALVLPVHIHMGFGQIIEDYVPARKYGFLNVLAVWAMRLVTVVSVYGCYVINSSDVGLTQLIARLWTGKKE